ncbi:MAG: amidohydrolase, partial [Gammaproteobacteria bacterium]
MAAVDPNNQWRAATPGSDGWPRSPRPQATNKYFMVSADCHVQEPNDFLSARMDAKYQDRLPGIVLGGDGAKLQKTEGFRPIRIGSFKLEGEDLERSESGLTPDERLAALDRDGVDCEILFPNKGLTVWATPDSEFSQAMCRAWNDWAWETFGPYNDRMAPMACIAAGDIEGAIAEV